MMRFQRRVLAAVGVSLIWLGTPADICATDFAAPKSYPVGTAPSFIVTGDFDGDGKPDLAVANTGSNDVSILLNNGDGTFKAAKNSPAGTSPLKMAAGDFNGDGKLDLVVINGGDGVFLLLGNGDGTFQPPGAVAADASPATIAVADFNEDQKLDLLLGDGAGGGLTLLPGKGDGTFQPAVTLPQITGSIAALTLGDFNGDKHLDVIVSQVVPNPGHLNSTEIILSLLGGKGDGTFQSAVTVTTLGLGFIPSNDTKRLSAPRLVSSDVNADGKLDLVVRYAQVTTVTPPCGIPPVHCGTFFTDNTFTLLGNGDGTFAGPNPQISFTGTSGGTLSEADFNDDSKADLLIGAKVLLGRGDGTFLVAEALPIPVSSFATAADLNGDTLPDVTYTDPTNNAVIVQLNDSLTSGADLALRLFPPPATATVGGGDISYTATVINEGPQDAAGVSLKESLPAGLTFVSAQPSVGTCTGTTVITCDLGAMVDVSAATVTFTVTPIAAGGLTDALQVLATTPDGNTKNNSASFTVTATVPADISVTGNVSKSSATVGDTVTYTLQVSNAGPADAANVTLNDVTNDPTLTPASVTVSQGSCTPSVATLSCSLGTLAKGGKINLSFALTMTKAEILTNGISVNSDTPDLNTADNGVTLTVAVDAANLSINESVSPTAAVTGNAVNYTITVTNKGPAQGTNVAVSDSFSGTVTVTPTAATPSQGTCTLDANTQITNCTLGALAPSASATITFSATVTVPAAASNGGTLSNNATVTSDQPDPDNGDNSASTTVTVSLPPDFSVTVPSPSLSLTRGGQVTETLSFPAQGGFSANITLACSVSGPSPMPACALSPASVAPDGSSTLTISAASISAFAADAPQMQGPSTGAGTGFYAAWLPLSLLGLIFAGRRQKGRRGRWMLSFVLAVVASVAAACGGGTSGPPQPQNYTVTVTATSGTTQHATSINVTLH
ncbi:MAG TPA: FG-GAP-like repeat-containing protein [Candidatus Acidoferrum sp.]|nr:FG-GAP-like repeat-containing protein [Candidatus Acidoferrum sp.]